MLLQITLTNFKTFRDRAVLSLIASNYDKKTREDDNIVMCEMHGFRILKSAVVFGSNAGGKSKFMEAVGFMRNFIIQSFGEHQKDDPIPVTPFLLNKTSEKEPTEMEVTFVLNDILYRYGFSVTRKQVEAEWLYYKPKTKEIELFYRDSDEVNCHPKHFAKGATLVKQGFLRTNALLLSTAAQFNDDIAGDVLNWFRKIRLLSGLQEDSYGGFTFLNLESKPSFKKSVLDLMKAADLNIIDIQPIKMDPEKLSEDLPESLRNVFLSQYKGTKNNVYVDAVAVHQQYDKDGKVIGTVPFLLNNDESSGTKKFLALTGPLIDTLANGYCLFVDELDSKLHPNLVRTIVSLFNSKKNNPQNAQLIFNTHDTNLLSADLFRRDQIWFIEKDRQEQSKLYSLADFKTDSVRKNESFEENYIRGKYGAIPYLQGFNNEISLKDDV